MVMPGTVPHEVVNRVLDGEANTLVRPKARCAGCAQTIKI